jgi:hypothetical protein
MDGPFMSADQFAWLEPMAVRFSATRALPAIEIAHCAWQELTVSVLFWAIGLGSIARCKSKKAAAHASTAAVD